MPTAACEALTNALKSLEDSKLRALFAGAEADELALAIRLLPLERGNAALVDVATERARAALDIVAESADDAPAPELTERLLRRVHRAGKERRGLVLAALDLVALALGSARR